MSFIMIAGLFSIEMASICRLVTDGYEDECTLIVSYTEPGAKEVRQWTSPTTTKKAVHDWHMLAFEQLNESKKRKHE